MKIVFAIVILSTCFFSCQFEHDQVQQEDFISFPNVDKELWTHFETFEREAAIRGLEINIVNRGISGEILELNQGNVAGVCHYGGYGSNHIEIDENFWNKASHLRREMIVFHELGHCYLDRAHEEDYFNNGACYSIMRSGTLGCYDNYVSTTREWYLDELFFGEEVIP